MNTKDLIYFQKLVETRSYTRTAAFFKLSQPTVSAMMKRLDEEYGVALIVQSSPRGRFTVTSAGKVLYERSKKICELLTMTKDEVKRADSANILLGVSPVVAQIWLPGFIKVLDQHKLLPNLQTKESGSEQLIHELDIGQVDVGLINTLMPLSNEKFNSMVLRTNTFRIVVSQNHPLAKKKNIDFSQLSNQNFVTMHRQFIHRAIFDIYCKHNKIKPRIVYETDNISILLALVRRNVGIALVTDQVAEHIPRIRALTLTGSLDLKTYTSLVVRHDFRMTRTQKSIVDLIKTTAN